MLDASVHSIRLTSLVSNTRYRICVLALGSWNEPASDESADQDNHNRLQQQRQFNDNTNNEVVMKRSSAPDLSDSPTSRCVDALTLESVEATVANGDSSYSVITRDSASTDDATNHNVLTRRLGLTIGSCMGFVVFILLISVLGYLKVSALLA